jgi:hypothetical protein
MSEVMKVPILLCLRKLVRKDRDINLHVFGEYKCGCCNEWVLEDHLCYIKRRETEKPCKKLIMYDFEAQQQTGEHVANW